MSDDLALTVGGQKLIGWTETSVTRGIEQMPSTFSVAATEGSPALSDAAAVQPGQACTVHLGPDKVITGYVDTVQSSYSAGQHVVQIAGRGKCQDLVDCSSEWPTGQISGANALEIAQKLAAPYGITATAPDGGGQTVPQFNINIGDTSASILELITRHAALLYYEGTDGNLILAQAADKTAASGFVEGRNVQSATVVRSVAGRYSDYKCSYLSINESPLFIGNDGLFFGDAADPNITRNRKLYIVAEGVFGGRDLCIARVKWEAARRSGRGLQVSITCDSWRDSAGMLWTPNTLAPVSLPRLKLPQTALCIALVTYRFALGSGRTAEVLLMPKEAFLPQPIVLQPLIPGLVSPAVAPITDIKPQTPPDLKLNAPNG